MEYDLITYEPPLTAEHMAKWQIRTTPTTLIQRAMWEKRDFLKEVEPFQRIPFATKPPLADYDAADRTPFLKKLPVKAWVEALGK